MQWLAAAYPAPTSTTATDTLYLPVGNNCIMEHSCLAQRMMFSTDQVHPLLQDHAL